MRRHLLVLAICSSCRHLLVLATHRRVMLTATPAAAAGKPPSHVRAILTTRSTLTARFSPLLAGCTRACLLMLACATSLVTLLAGRGRGSAVNSRGTPAALRKVADESDLDRVLTSSSVILALFQCARCCFICHRLAAQARHGKAGRFRTDRFRARFQDAAQLPIEVR